MKLVNLLKKFVRMLEVIVILVATIVVLPFALIIAAFAGISPKEYLTSLWGTIQLCMADEEEL